jgi:peptidoglycan hydrolase-like protein with peptidoglycan-binding domain
MCVPKFSFLLLALAITWPITAATAKKRTHKRPSTPATTSRKAPVKATPAKSKSTRRGTTKAKAAAVVHRHNYQSSPTSDRYKEIQQALVTKGYMKSDATGEWNGESAEALKRFQADQNLTPDGKLNSLSLIALGLGPKRMAAASQPSAEVELPRAELSK